MSKRNLIKEVKRFQKIAGLLRESATPSVFKVGERVAFRYEGEPIKFGEITDIAKNWDEATVKGGDNFDIWTDFWNNEEVWTNYGYNSFEEWEKDQVDPLKNNIWYKIEGEGGEEGWFPAEYVEDFKGYSMNEWHPDKDWDEEDDQEETGDDYPSDEDLFGLDEDADYEGQTGDTATMGNINETEPRKKGTLDQKEKIVEKLQYAIEDYLEDIGLKELSKEERPKFQKGLGFTQTTPSDVFFNKTGISFHATTPDDDPRRNDPRHNDQEAVYSLRIYKPNEKFNISTLRGFIQQAKKEAKAEGFRFFDTVRRSNQDILCNVTVR